MALGRQRALRLAQQAYQSLSAGENAAAIEQAHAAVELAPDVASYRLLLITAQLQGDQLADAERSADQALQADGQDLNARVMRGYLRQRQGNTVLANEDFDTALAAPGSAMQQRNVRLLAVDAALAAGDRLRCWHRCRRRYRQVKAMHGHSSFCSRASSNAAGRSAPVASFPASVPKRTWHQSSTASPLTAAASAS